MQCTKRSAGHGKERKEKKRKEKKKKESGRGLPSPRESAHGAIKESASPARAFQLRSDEAGGSRGASPLSAFLHPSTRKVAVYPSPFTTQNSSPGRSISPGGQREKRRAKNSAATHPKGLRLASPGSRHRAAPGGSVPWATGFGAHDRSTAPAPAIRGSSTDTEASLSPFARPMPPHPRIIARHWSKAFL